MKLKLAALFVLLTSLAPNCRANVYTLTTAASSGGMDGWINSFNEKSLTDTQLRVGNLRATAYDRSDTILMFNLASIQALLSDQIIVSATLSYYVVSSYGTSTRTIVHVDKQTTTLAYSPDFGTGASYSSYDIVGNSNKISGVDSIDVTAQVNSDIENNNAYTSYLLYQADTNGEKKTTFPWGQYIASSENTSGYAVPTLTITTEPVPEVATLGICGIGALCFLIRRSKSGH